MGKLKRLVTVIFLGMCTCACFAKQISFQVVQHDSTADAVTEQSLEIEDEVLNKFFDYGFIVTNSDAAVSDSESQDEVLFNSGIGEAFNGYSDYFVQIKVFYEKTSETTQANADLQKIDFTVANAKTGVKIADSSLEYVKTGKKDDLKNVSSNLVNKINKALIVNKA